MQTHRLTNLNTQTPLRPSHFIQNSQTPSLTPSLISLLCVLRPSSLFSVFRALCECSVLLQPSGVLSLLFSWIFILCFLRFLSFKLLRKVFVNLKIYVLDCWLLAVFFFLFFQFLWELKGFVNLWFVICDLWFVGVKGFCVFLLWTYCVFFLWTWFDLSLIYLVNSYYL